MKKLCMHTIMREKRALANHQSIFNSSYIYSTKFQEGIFMQILENDHSIILTLYCIAVTIVYVWPKFHLK